MLGVREETNASRAENGKGPAMAKEGSEGAGMEKADDSGLTGLVRTGVVPQRHGKPLEGSEQRSGHEGTCSGC